MREYTFQATPIDDDDIWATICPRLKRTGFNVFTPENLLLLEPVFIKGVKTLPKKVLDQVFHEFSYNSYSLHSHLDSNGKVWWTTGIGNSSEVTFQSYKTLNETIEEIEIHYGLLVGGLVPRSSNPISLGYVESNVLQFNHKPNKDSYALPIPLNEFQIIRLEPLDRLNALTIHERKHPLFKSSFIGLSNEDYFYYKWNGQPVIEDYKPEGINFDESVFDINEFIEFL
jgi:hypothetical protein